MNTRPVPGWKANEKGFRNPTAQIALFSAVGEPVMPGNEVGLSAGIVASVLMRRILPRRLLIDWLLAEFAFSPTATYSLPSGPNWIAPPLWFVAEESPSRLSRL